MDETGSCNSRTESTDNLISSGCICLQHDPCFANEHPSKPRMRPYPVQYVFPFTLRDNTEVTLRPIRPEDEPMMRKFHTTLSDRTVYMRYFCSLSLSSRISHERLLHICFADYDHQIALVVEREDPLTGERSILGVGRLSKFGANNEAEVAIVVSDEHQRKGLGKELLRRLMQVGREEGIARLSGEILCDNIAVLSMFNKAGFTVHMLSDSSSVKAVLDLN